MSKNNPSKSMKEINQTGNVDQIREILFGSQERDLTEKFEKFQLETQVIQKEILSKIEQNQKDLNDKLTNEMKVLSKKIKNISVQQQDELADIRKNEIKQEKRIQNSIDILNDEFQTKNDQLYKSQIKYRDSLKKDINSLRNELSTVIESKLKNIKKSKVSKGDVAQMMIEMAINIQGTKKTNKKIKKVKNSTKKKK